MGVQMIVRLDEKVKERFFQLARMEGKTASQKIRLMVENYVKTNDYGSVIDDLWSRAHRKIKKKGIKEKDVDQIIRQTRSGK